MVVKERPNPTRYEAHRWFKGIDVPGVCGTDPYKLCGCVMVGGPSNVPHVHTSVLGGVVIEPGVWVVTTADDPFPAVYTDDEFHARFESAPAEG